MTDVVLRGEFFRTAGGLKIADGGGVTWSLAGNVLQVASLSGAALGAGSVANVNLADMAADTIKGRAHGAGTGVPQDLTATQVKAILSLAYSDISGLATVAHTGAYSDLTGTPTIPTGANPSGSIGLAAVNGSAATFMRSDGAPALSQAIAPTWTGVHIFTPGAGIAITVNGVAGSACLLLKPADSASVGMQITDPGAAGVLLRLATTNAAAILTAVNGTLNLNVGASTIATVSSTGVNVGGALTSKSASAGVGYATGAGGAVTQGSSRTTAVTLDKVCGTITMFSAAGSTTAASFTVNNAQVAATDTVVVCQASGTNLYDLLVTAVAAGSFRITFRTTSGTATDAPVINFAVIKAVAS